jgi:hypothetical protein
VDLEGPIGCKSVLRPLIVMTLKNIKIHIWFIINLAVIVLLFYDRRFFIGPVCSVFFASSFLRRKWGDVKKEYTSPVPKKFVFLVLGFILLLIISAFSGLTKESNQAFLYPTVGLNRRAHGSTLLTARHLCDSVATKAT